jgi:hypothetical protein
MFWGDGWSKSLSKSLGDQNLNWTFCSFYGFINPVNTPETDSDENITDIPIHYSENSIDQNLLDSKNLQ